MATAETLIKKEKIKDFDDLKTHLAKASAGDKKGSLYDHVSDIMSHIVTHCPEEALNKLEEISYLIKNHEEVPME